MKKVDKRLYAAYEEGYQAAMLALADINILSCSATEGRTEYVVEYKRWYGTDPGDSRWQRVSVSCAHGGDMYTYKDIIGSVAKIREALEDITGIPQDVRH